MSHRTISKDDTILTIVMAGLLGVVSWIAFRPVKPAEYAEGDVMRIPFTCQGYNGVYEIRFTKGNLGLTLRQVCDMVRDHIRVTLETLEPVDIRCIQETPKWHSGVTVWSEPVAWFRGRHLKFYAAPIVNGESRWTLADQVAFAATTRDITYG